MELWEKMKSVNNDMHGLRNGTIVENFCSWWAWITINIELSSPWFLDSLSDSPPMPRRWVAYKILSFFLFFRNSRTCPSTPFHPRPPWLKIEIIEPFIKQSLIKIPCCFNLLNSIIGNSISNGEQGGIEDGSEREHTGRRHQLCWWNR